MNRAGRLTAERAADQVPDVSIHPGVERYWSRWLARCVWMAVLCGLVGAGSAYAWILLQPATYRSTARLQIVDQGTGTTASDRESETLTSLGDEVFVVRSEQVLRRAASSADLSSSPPFTGMSAQEVAAALAESLELVVQPANSQLVTNVIQIEYDVPAPTTSQRVVQAILDAYLQHSQEKFEKGDVEALSQILAARDEAFEKLQKMELEHNKFLKGTNLLFVDNEPISVHRKTADRFLAQREELLIEKSQLESRLRSAERNLQESDPQTVMLALKADSETASDVIDQNISRQLERLQNELRDRASVRTRESSLLPLQLERDALLKKFGRSHPQIVGIQTQIDVVEKQIARMQAEEEEKERLIKKVMSIGGKSDAEEGKEGELDPQAELRKRVEMAIAALKQQLASIEQQLESVNDSYQTESAAAKEEVEAVRESERFERDIERQRELYEKILARIDDVSLLSADQGIAVSVLDSPRLGVKVERPMGNLTTIGGFIGALAGLILGMMFPPRQRSFHHSNQVVEDLRMPVLGHVPPLPTIEASQAPAGALEHTPIDPKLCTVGAPYGGAAEEFNAIRTALLCSDAAKDKQIIQVTSAAPGVGKSTVTANLAVSIARTGKRVLLIDADFRRPKIQGLFGLPESRGLGWLLDHAPPTDEPKELADQIRDVIQQGPVANLSVMAAGSTQGNPSDVFSGDCITFVYDALRDMFDRVLIDSPPILAVTDTSVLARRADAVLLVVGSEQSDVQQATRATDMLAKLRANVIGVIVNGNDHDGATEKGYRVYPAPYDFRLSSTSVRAEDGHSHDE